MVPLTQGVLEEPVVMEVQSLAPRPGGGTMAVPLPPPVRLTEVQRLSKEVLPLAVRRIVIDPGHGGRDVGTVTPDGLYEKDLTLDIGERLRDTLLEDSFDVRMTRESDRYVVLKERAQFANASNADLFVSIHLNWIKEDRRIRGVETYFLGPTRDPYLVRLAGEENRESGYSLADSRHLLEQIYLDLRREQSQALAGDVQDALFRSLRQENPGLRDRGIKTAPFLVLVATDMPAILAEVSCLSNREEAELLTQASYRQRIADALHAGIRSYAREIENVQERGS
jgi:N-acetylmuramoyl-L-alanine amidase